MAVVWPDSVTHFLCVSVRTCGTYVRAEGHPEKYAGGMFRRRWHAARCSGTEGFSGGNIGDDMTYRKWLRCNRCYSKQTVVSAVPTTWREPSGTSHVSQPLMPFSLFRPLRSVEDGFARKWRRGREFTERRSVSDDWGVGLTCQTVVVCREIHCLSGFETDKRRNGSDGTDAYDALLESVLRELHKKCFLCVIFRKLLVYFLHFV